MLVREKIEEAYADAAKHGFEPLNIAKIKAELSQFAPAMRQSVQLSL
jgi:hypothetical protein